MRWLGLQEGGFRLHLAAFPLVFQSPAPGRSVFPGLFGTWSPAAGRFPGILGTWSPAGGRRRPVSLGISAPGHQLVVGAGRFPGNFGTWSPAGGRRRPFPWAFRHLVTRSRSAPAVSLDFSAPGHQMVVRCRPFPWAFMLSARIAPPGHSQIARIRK
jgi:hypothetical protein